MAGPDLMIARYYHACSMMTYNDGRYVVVTGGKCCSVAFCGSLDTTEYLDLDDPTAWKTGLTILTSRFTPFSYLSVNKK